MSKRLRVGFDLDGVILYNPARIIRPLVALFKKKFLKKRQYKFYVPQSKPEQLLWDIFHKSSLFVAEGFTEIEHLAKQKKIDPYIITARYDFLKKDFDLWIKKMRADTYCVDCIHNKENNQPHLYKEEMIRKLDLDVFVEDNLDIVLHLKKKFPDKTIIWIYNILDRNKPYEPKFPTLNKAITYIKTEHL
ncbi:MAG: hypothetical protein ACOCXQ_01465 [Patescibacteria group bacterium]